jgi:hypothetical protein
VAFSLDSASARYPAHDLNEEYSMRTVRVLAIAVLGAAALACGGDDEPSIESISGTWDIVKFEYVNVENSSQRVDLVAEGLTGTVNLNDNGQYAATTEEPGFPPETVTGTWSYTADTFTLKETGSTGDATFDMDVGNDVLTLTGANADYDFNDDGVPEAAKWNVTLERQ